jgi:hypothetical protein
LFTLGARVVPTGSRPANTESTLYGEGWIARRTPGGCFLEWDAGQLMSEYITAEISPEEFERLRAEPEAFREVAGVHERERVFPRELNAAIVAYLQWRTSGVPKRDAEAARAVAAKGDPEVLLARVGGLVRECGRVEVDWSTHDLAEGAALARVQMASRYPELDDEALDALSWDFSYGWK